LKINFGMIAIIAMWSADTTWAQAVQSLSEIETIIQKSADGVDLCFLPVETVLGAQVHVVVESFPLRSSASVYNGLKSTTLTVSNSGEPVVIILNTRGRDDNWVWWFDVEANANVVGVHLISDELPRLEGIPSDIPVTARYRVEGRQNDCDYPVVMDAAQTGLGPEYLRSKETAFRKWSGAFGLPSLDADLFDYAGINVVSYQFSSGGWENATVEISDTSAQEFLATKTRGKSLLDAAVPPALPFIDEMVGSLRVPEELQQGEVWPWVVSQGYAMPVPDDLLTYLCRIDRLMEMSLGVVLPSAACRWGGLGTQAANGLVLLGAIEMSSETCRITRQPRPLFARFDLAVSVDGSDCSIYTYDINRKTLN